MWYEPPANQTYRSYALPPNEMFPDVPVSLAPGSADRGYPPDAEPVFFGHYCLKAERPAVLAPNVPCLDYSVAKGGMLCAYRWQGERQLTNENFVVIPARKT